MKRVLLMTVWSSEDRQAADWLLFVFEVFAVVLFGLSLGISAAFLWGGL